MRELGLHSLRGVLGSPTPPTTLHAGHWLELERSIDTSMSSSQCFRHLPLLDTLYKMSLTQSPTASICICIRTKLDLFALHYKTTSQQKQQRCQQKVSRTMLHAAITLMAVRSHQHLSNSRSSTLKWLEPWHLVRVKSPQMPASPSSSTTAR